MLQLLELWLYRWAEYQPLGNPVVGTRFVSFKVPLKEVGLYSEANLVV